ncbi:M23 family metallopeptidase [Acidaminobacter sp. JC074]|uniref:M23 family metallopeptidase n=1 Tax=Acidaminobacter sp. JC074 TaxID=2530199 RepID=UPI001F0DCE0D|nr:M23 family metallopeptidase [Acidaminobacter sp. JC074]
MAFFRRNGLVIIALTLGLTACSSQEAKTEIQAYEVSLNGESIGYSVGKVDESWIENNTDEDIRLELEQTPILEDVQTLEMEKLLSKIEDKYETLLLENIEEVIELSIGERSWILGSEEEACQVIKSSIETLLDKDVEAVVAIRDGKIEVSYLLQDQSVKSVEIIEPMTASVDLTDREDVLPVEQAIDEITKKTEKPKMYEVQAGDVPGTIAQDHEMSLKSLYEMNPDLEGRDAYVQIGEELIVTVPEPEMTIRTVETITYDEVIEKGYTYQNDDSLYVGTYKTISYGSNGSVKVTAEVEKLDGKEVGREIVDESIMVSPVNAIIASGTKALPEKGALGTFISPLENYVLTSEFGPRWNAQHRGIDMAANTGTSIRASDGGTVTYAGWWGSYGYLVEIDHGNGFKTRYGHNSKILVVVGQVVSQYEQVALVGSTGNSTGPHLHFEIMINDIPVDPYLYME